MIGFEVEINGKKEYRIAAKERMGISIEIEWERSLKIRMPAKEHEVSKNNAPYLFIVGLTFPEKGNSKEDEEPYIHRALSIKDRIKIKIIEFEDFDKLEGDNCLVNPSEREIYYNLHEKESNENKKIGFNKLRKSFICYSVRLNTTNVCTAGVGQFGRLTASINWTDQALENKIYPCATTNGKVEFRVSGTTSSLNRNKEVYMSWVERDLVIGDEVNIFLFFSVVNDKPTRRIKMSIERDD